MVRMMPTITLYHQEHVESSSWTGNFFEVAYDDSSVGLADGQETGHKAAHVTG